MGDMLCGTNTLDVLKFNFSKVLVLTLSGGTNTLDVLKYQCPVPAISLITAEPTHWMYWNLSPA